MSFAVCLVFGFSSTNEQSTVTSTRIDEAGADDDGSGTEFPVQAVKKRERNSRKRTARRAALLPVRVICARCLFIYDFFFLPARITRKAGTPIRISPPAATMYQMIGLEASAEGGGTLSATANR